MQIFPSCFLLCGRDAITSTESVCTETFVFIDWVFGSPCRLHGSILGLIKGHISGRWATIFFNPPLFVKKGIDANSHALLFANYSSKFSLGYVFHCLLVGWIEIYWDKISKAHVDSS